MRYMKYNPFGFFGLLRPGALVDEEEHSYLDQHIRTLDSIPGWAEKAAVLVSAYTGENIALTVDRLQMFLYKVRQTKDHVPTSTLRYYADTLAAIAQLISQPSPMAPAPEPLPAPIPTGAATAALPEPLPPPPVAPAPMPVATEPLASNPPPPSGFMCPHYNRSLEPPTKWDDPAAAQRYLQKYPDVNVAVTKNIQPSALWHYRCYGRKEGRTWEGWGGYQPARRPKKLRPGTLGDVRIGGHAYSGRRVRRPGNLG